MQHLANGHKTTLLDQELTYLNSLDLRLFVNNHVPADTDTVAAYTECTDTGYLLNFPVNNVGFGASFLNGSNEAETDAATQTAIFSHAGGDFTVYGYYLTDPASGDSLVIAERAPFPFDVTAAGLPYSVTCRKVMTTQT